MPPQSCLFMLRLSLCLSVLLLGLSTAWAQLDAWTTVGSAGTVDEADTGLVLLGSPVPGAVMIRPTEVGILNIRYNIVAVGGLFGGEGHVLSVRYRDNGADGQVIVQLKQLGLYTGITTTLLTLDSNASAPSTSFQVQSIGSCATVLNFAENAYFMDVQIRKTALTGTPALALIQLGATIC
jgi:hypothetical protein